ncbi:hypothetical protein L195_g059423 [Trifolium pratense]|uniref:Uncharacterized protein n=1 Tax=Trifolium pratense TaxID=57577 RepID=A0A2K3JXY2_TRIPR|nr:hypothetical protein L195_g059423 [Trifolium pratense]
MLTGARQPSRPQAQTDKPDRPCRPQIQPNKQSFTTSEGPSFPICSSTSEMYQALRVLSLNQQVALELCNA